MNVQRLLFFCITIVTFSLVVVSTVLAIHPGTHPDGFTEIIDNNKPAIVYIQVTTKAGNKDSTAHNKILKDIFGDAPDKDGNAPFFTNDTGYSFGSGFIINQDGYILTNYHVIKNATEVSVTTGDKQNFKATIIGSDPKTDIGLIKIDAENLPTIPLGNSDSIKTGQWVLAFGSPYEFIQSVTAGIISATGRHTLGISDYEDFIQTDAAINPGNSGGPLVNTNGEAIGINTAFLTQTGGYMGIGFAIPINIARTVAEQLITNGKVTRAWLGISMQDADAEHLAAQNLPQNTQAARILEVKDESPAKQAGLQEGDIITSFAGIAIKGASDLRNRVALSAPEADVVIEFFRNSNRQSVRVHLTTLK